MVILQTLTLIMMAVLLMSMMAQVRPWKRIPLPGKPLQTIPLGILPKLVTFRSSLMALFTGCILTALAGWLSLNMVAMIAAFALIILLVPMQYTLTTKGIAVGEAIFRPWSDFSGFKAGTTRLDLAHPSFFGRLTLFVKPAEMNSVLKYVQRHVKTHTSNSPIEGE